MSTEANCGSVVLVDDTGDSGGDDPPDEWDMSVECVSSPPSEVTVGETFTVEFAVTNETNDIQQYSLEILGSGGVLDETESAAQSGDTRTHSFTIDPEQVGDLQVSAIARPR